MRIARPILIIIIFLVIMGVLGLSLNMAFGNETVMYITKYKMVQLTPNATGLYYYKFDFKKYISNLNLSISDTSKLILEWPKNDSAWYTLVVDYVILIGNILMYPLRISAYIIKNACAIIGINTNTTSEYNGMAWLIQFCNSIMEYAKIPYVGS